VADAVALANPPAGAIPVPPRVRLPLSEPALVRGLLLAIALAFLGLFVVLPSRA
jgi:hypothetical protein